MRVWRTLHTEGIYPYHIQRMQYLEPADMCSRLEFSRRINANPHSILNIFFHQRGPFYPQWNQQYNKFPFMDRYTPHGTVESKYHHRSSTNVWCDVIGYQLIDNSIFPQHQTGDIYASVLQRELTALLEDVPLQTRRQICYQHDGVSTHCIQIIKQYLNLKFPKRWIGRGGAQNWPPRSPDLEPIRLPCVGSHESYGVCTQGEHEKRTSAANSQRCKKQQKRCSSSYGGKFSGHRSKKMYPSRWRPLRTICMGGKRCICSCTFNSLSQ